jgi:hypothetical protein
VCAASEKQCYKFETLAIAKKLVPDKGVQKSFERSRIASKNSESPTRRGETTFSAVAKVQGTPAQQRLASRLKNLKTESNITWKTIAKESGVSYRWLLDISNGHTPLAETRNVIRDYFSRVLERRIRF